MAAYTFYLHDHAGEVPAFEIEAFERDEEAIGYARRLLSSRPRYDGIEVMSGERRVCALRRSSVQTGAATFSVTA